MARGFFPQQQPHRDRNNGRPERKCVLCGGSHWASQCPEEQRKDSRKEGICDSICSIQWKFATSFRAETSMFSQETLETGRALIDCGATRCMGSWKELGGLARMNEQLYGSPCSLPGSYEEDLVHLCRWRETTERTCGRISGKRWRKDEWLQDRLPECNRSTHSSVCTEHLQDGRHYGLQHRCHILSESDRPGLRPTGARGKWTSLCVTGEGYALSNQFVTRISCLDSKQQQEFWRILAKKGQDSPSAHADGGTGEL